MELDLLNQYGIKIQASAKISSLPNEIIASFTRQGILFSQNDTIYLIGHGGRSFWDKLTKPLIRSQNPIDLLTIDLIKKLDPEANILYPHSSWVIPLQKLGRFLNISRPSLLGIDISQDYGLWFAFRGAFISKVETTEVKLKSFNSACLDCVSKDCIASCPVQAVVDIGNSFNLPKCIDYSILKNSLCENQCLARLSCPFKQEHQYSKEQIYYHSLR